MPVFDTITVKGDEALKQFDALRREFITNKGPCPFLIGNDKELEHLRALIEPPDDAGAAIIAAAASLDIAVHLKEKGYKKPRALAKKPVPAQAGFHSLAETDYSTMKRRIKPDIHVGLIAVANSWEIFARLGYSNCNVDLEPVTHVALHKYWHEKFGSFPVFVSSDIVECFVPKPPTETPAVLQLAGEQYAYCPDIVDQGVGSVASLASSLLGAKVWYFWWD